MIPASTSKTPRKVQDEGKTEDKTRRTPRAKLIQLHSCRVTDATLSPFAPALQLLRITLQLLPGCELSGTNALCLRYFPGPKVSVFFSSVFVPGQQMTSWDDDYSSRLKGSTLPRLKSPVSGQISMAPLRR